MKYLIFMAMFFFGVPMMIMAAYSFTRIRNLLFMFLIFSTCLGDMANINFISMEHYRGPDRGFEMNLTDLIGIALLVTFIFKYPSRIKWLPYNSFAMFALFGSAFISTLIAPEPLFSAFTLFKLMKCYFLYMVIANGFRCDISKAYVWGAFLCICIFVVFLCLQQRYLHGIHRVHGPFDHSNTIPIFVNQVFPLMLLWGLCDRTMKWWQITLTLGAGLGLVVAVVLTLSRAGIVMCLGIIMAAILISVIRRTSYRITTFTLAVCIFGAAGALKAADTILDRFLHAPDASRHARDEFEVVAMMMSKEHVFGVGLNNFSLVMTVTPRYRKHLVTMANEEEAGVVHHIYLLTSAEMGYIGLALYLLVIARFMLASSLTFLKFKSLDGILMGGYALGFFSTHATGMLEWALRISPVTYLFTISCGLAAATMDELKRRDKEEKYMQHSIPNVGLRGA